MSNVSRFRFEYLHIANRPTVLIQYSFPRIVARWMIVHSSILETLTLLRRVQLLILAGFSSEFYRVVQVVNLYLIPFYHPLLSRIALEPPPFPARPRFTDSYRSCLDPASPRLNNGRKSSISVAFPFSPLIPPLRTANLVGPNK